MSVERGLAFHPLSFVPDGDDVVVGRADTGSYAVLPADGAELLRRLSSGMSPDAAAEWYRSEFDEDVDIDDFLAEIAELGFVRTDGEVAGGQPRPRFQWLGQALFSLVAWIGYAGIVIWWAVVAAPHGDILPNPAQVYFTGSLIAVQLVVVTSQIPLGFLHESFHVLAGQRLGLSSTLAVSNRFTYVVFETRINGLMSVPRRQRYLVVCAGMLADIVVLCLLDLAAELTRSPGGALSFAGRLCLTLAFTTVARIGWQFMFYLRTDLYFVLATALRCHDLHDAGVAIFRNRLRRLAGRTDRLVDETQWTERDRRIGAWYGWFICAGILVAIGLTVFLSVPVLIRFVQQVVAGLGSADGATFWDAAISLVLLAVQLGLPAVLARRKRRLDTSRKPRLAVDPGGN
ncbi:MAG TPA: hypothetical protein VHV49_14920 [Pseudonocardiaceae bacterium]|jgi:hypothetical protein|nr:hypothetical protein [Pseudonocardiaceae bacterium]